MLRKLWDVFSDVETSVWLLVLIAATLACGAYCIKAWPLVFGSLNNLLLQDWYLQTGSHHWEKIWWLFLLFFLLFLLGVNTFVCTWNRLSALWMRRSAYGGRMFSIRLCPSFIHLCFLAVLAGHLLSEIAGFNALYPVQPGHTITLPGGEQVIVEEMRTDRYKKPDIIAGNVKDRSLLLRLDGGSETTEKTVTYLDPVLWHGYTFHLKTGHSGEESPTAKLQVRHDPGLPVIVTAFVVMMALLLWYFLQYPAAERFLARAPGEPWTSPRGAFNASRLRSRQAERQGESEA